MMKDVFIATWTGGYDQPSFSAHWTEHAARQQAESWAQNADEGDTILVLRINGDAADEPLAEVVWSRFFD